MKMLKYAACAALLLMSAGQAGAVSGTFVLATSPQF